MRASNYEDIAYVLNINIAYLPCRFIICIIRLNFFLSFIFFKLVFIYYKNYTPLLNIKTYKKYLIILYYTIKHMLINCV